MSDQINYYLLRLHFTPECVADMALDLAKGGAFLERLEHLPATIPSIRHRGAWAPNVDMAPKLGWSYLLLSYDDAIPILSAAIQQLPEVHTATINRASKAEVEEYQRRLIGK